MEDNCPVCLVKPVNSKADPCGHEFCTSCILEWSETSYTCPMCRAIFFEINRFNGEIVENQKIVQLKADVVAATFTEVNRMALHFRVLYLWNKERRKVASAVAYRTRNTMADHKMRYYRRIFDERANMPDDVLLAQFVGNERESAWNDLVRRFIDRLIMQYLRRGKTDYGMICYRLREESRLTSEYLDELFDGSLIDAHFRQLFRAFGWPLI